MSRQPTSTNFRFLMAFVALRRSHLVSVLYVGGHMRSWLDGSAGTALGVKHQHCHSAYCKVGDE